MSKSKNRFINCDLSARIITYVEEGTLGSAMNLAPRFQLNLAEKFPRLLHAPVVEAVILINAPPTKPFQQVELREILTNRFVDYVVQDQMQFETDFRGSAEGSVELHHKSQWDGYRLHSRDEKHVCQWKRSCLIFSRLQPYETWNEFVNAALPFWDTYREVAEPEIIEAVSVRFISQIPLRSNEKPSKYVQQVPLPLKGLGLRADSFFHQDSIPLKGYPYELKLIRAMQPAAEKSGSKNLLIVDIDVSTTSAVPFDQLAKSLEEMRTIKNKVFFTYMKDAEKRFK